MKKIAIISAALMGCFMAQASTVAWSLSNVMGKSGTALDSGSVYVFFVAGNSAADTSSWAGLANKGAAALTTAVAGANYSYSVDSGAAGTFTKSAMALADAGVSPSTKYSVYAVVFDTTSITDSSNFYVTTATAATTTFSDASALTKTYMLNSGSSATASNWNAVAAPEPTSGLLLLLGVAGLALKRKRA